MFPKCKINQFLTIFMSTADLHKLLICKFTTYEFLHTFEMYDVLK